MRPPGVHFRTCYVHLLSFFERTSFLLKRNDWYLSKWTNIKLTLVLLWDPYTHHICNLFCIFSDQLMLWPKKEKTARGTPCLFFLQFWAQKWHFPNVHEINFTKLWDPLEFILGLFILITYSILLVYFRTNLCNGQKIKKTARGTPCRFFFLPILGSKVAFSKCAWN